MRTSINEGHGDIYVADYDFAVGINVAGGEESIEDVHELVVVDVDSVEVGRHPAGLDGLPTGELVVVVRVHEHDCDLFVVQWMPRVQ